ncbi:DMT family transporter [Nakamurella sp. A5-74]|uniref:DMT family transporter n=1 Tax=Nakamurella sp. A5-74 TaxID=3158264 RepID=A0AAU8DT92_9ACTN
MTTQTRARRGLLLITLAGVLWGTTGIVVHWVNAATGMDALTIGFWRLLVSAVVMVLFSVRTLPVLLGAVRRFPVKVPLAGVGLAAYQGLYFLSVLWTGVTVATMVSLGIAPVLTAIWESVRDRRRPTIRKSVVVVLALAGLGLIGTSGTSAVGTAPGWGLLAAIGSGTVYAAVTLLCESMADAVPARAMTTAMSISGAMTLAPWAFSHHLFPGTSAGLSGISVVGLVYIGVITTAAAYAAFNAGLRTVPSSTAAVLTLWEPITAAALAVALLHEAVTAGTAVGSGLLILAVTLLYLRPPRRRSSSVAPTSAGTPPPEAQLGPLPGPAQIGPAAVRSRGSSGVDREGDPS